MEILVLIFENTVRIAVVDRNCAHDIRCFRFRSSSCGDGGG